MKKDIYNRRYLLLFTMLIGITLTTFAQVPTVTSFSPTSGRSGDVVTLTGTNFNPTPANNIVFFGATKATVTAATAISVTVTLPTSATYAPITLTNRVIRLTASSLQNFTPTYSPAKTAITATDFQTKQDFNALTLPLSIAIGDLNGNDKPEMVVVNSGLNYVTVYINASIKGSIGPNSFGGSALAFLTGTNPRSVAIGDLDYDGKPDLVVANEGSNTISVFRNNSDVGAPAIFDAKVYYPTGTSPFSVAIGHLDGDGRPDLVVTNQNWRVTQT